jgi:hypothetical protein
MVFSINMIQGQKRYKRIIKDIKFTMIRDNYNCWIKIEPLKPASTPSSLYIILNEELYHWEIYNKNGKEDHVIYFEGLKCIPIFYLKTSDDNFKIKCDIEDIKVKSIKKLKNLQDFLKKECNIYSLEASCWAKAVFYTSRPDKYPFNEM